MYGVDTVSVSLRKDFGARLARVREAHNGKSCRDDFFQIARELFPVYGEKNEDFRDFMSRVSRLLRSRKEIRKENHPSTRRLTSEDEEITEEASLKPEELPLWKEVDGEILPPD